MNLNKTQKIIVIALVALIILTGLVVYYEKIRIPKLVISNGEMIRAEVDVDSWKSQKVIVVKGNKDRYTTINDGDIAYMDIPLVYLNDNVILDKNDVVGKVFNMNVNNNQIIYTSMIENMQDISQEGDRECEIRVKYIVGDKVDKGSLIDLILVKPNSYDVVISKVRVNEVINPYEQVIKNEDGTEEVVTTNAAARDYNKEYLLIVNLSEVEFARMKASRNEGYYEARKYINEDQEASIVTYGQAMQE